LWQWVRHKAKTADGKLITPAYLDQITGEELKKIKAEIGDERFNAGKFDLAAKLFSSTTRGAGYSDFLTTLCYDNIVTIKKSKL
jgi:malate synthase